MEVMVEKVVVLIGNMAVLFEPVAVLFEEVVKIVVIEIDVNLLTGLINFPPLF